MLNYALSGFGVSPVPWLTSQFWAMPSIALMKVWTDVGFYGVIFLAALQGMPGDLIDAAKVDGATDWQAFWHIKLPMLNPVLVFCIVMGTLWAMQVFAEPLLMTRGGAGRRQYLDPALPLPARIRLQSPRLRQRWWHRHRRAHPHSGGHRAQSADARLLR